MKKIIEINPSIEEMIEAVLDRPKNGEHVVSKILYEANPISIGEAEFKNNVNLGMPEFTIKGTALYVGNNFSYEIDNDIHRPEEKYYYKYSNNKIRRALEEHFKYFPDEAKW